MREKNEQDDGCIKEGGTLTVSEIECVIYVASKAILHPPLWLGEAKSARLQGVPELPTHL